MTLLLWLFAFAAGGFLLWGPFGLVFGALLGWALGNHLRRPDTELRDRIDDLERRLADLERRVNPQATEAAGQTPAPVTPTTARAPEEPVSTPDSVSPDKPTATLAPATRTRPVDAWTSADDAEPAADLAGARDSALQRLLRFFAGGNPVVRVGVLLLFFGVAFLARYAAERGWVSVELRLAGIAAASIGVFLLGWRLRERPGAYGLVLQGGAIGALYITVFTAARLYGLIPMELAFALMVALVLFSAVLALLQDARWLALFGVTGGFLAPVLTSTGGGSHVALFSYYALINLGILGIAWFRAWRELNLAGFAFTFVIGSAWGYRYYRPEHFASTEPFLILFFVFYIAIAVLFALRQAPRLQGYVDGSLVFGVPLAAFALQAALTRDMDYGLAYSALAVAALYLLLAYALWQRVGERLRLLAEAFLALAVVFATLAVPLALDGRWTAAVWALEGAALVWVGIRQQRLLPRLSGVLLQLGAGVAFFNATIDSYTTVPIWNARWLGSVTVAFAGLFSSWYLQRHATALRPLERRLPLPLLIWGLACWLGAGTLEIEAHVPWRDHTHALGMLFAGSAAVAAMSWRRLAWQALAGFSAWLAPTLVLLLVLEWAILDRPHALVGWGTLTWPLALASALLVLWRCETVWPQRRTLLWHAIGLWSVTALLTWELDWLIGDRLVSAATWHQIAWAMLPAIAVLALLKWGDRLAWPLARHATAYRVLGAGVLAVYLLLWSVAAGFAPGDSAPLPYVPLLNPLDLAQLLALLTVLRWLLWWRDGAPQRAARIIPMPAYPLLALSSFFWLNVALTRAVHFWGAVDWRWSALIRSETWHSAVSLLWTLTALILMVAASRLGQRRIWYTGAVLLAVVVVKLFLVDLTGIGTLGRIVSFLGVGGLMLVIGFFSPLPPRQREPQAEEPHP